ncbi:unnamed protein product [Danaus chrysippus]|uniref:(African queen) hypothetical protein n=1 Tax=Danaus chrysippus TaxID=151541 RepID=A0A8J2R538_9NEOP|nr:unnamed protein product [Danaus chrysippus]
MPGVFRKHAEAIYNFKVRPDDVWVVSVPRSGLKKASQTPSWKTLEMAPSPRFIKTHLPLSMLPPNLLNTAKVIYVARDPRDVAVSYYYLHKMIAKKFMRASFTDFWNAFKRDLLPMTPVIEHANESWNQRHNKNLHFLFYEDMKKDLVKEIQGVCKFLDRNYTDEKINELASHLSFDSFRNNKNVNNNADGDGKIQFIRKGEAGGWRTHFDAEMKIEAEDYLSERLKGLDLKYPSWGSK